jgi:prolyl-tRNA synthetase
LKSLVYRADKDLVLAVVRGDHEVNEIKLARALGVSEVALAEGPEVESVTGAVVGFAGPIGFKGKVIVDRDAASIRDAITGANRSDTHLQHVQHGRDYQGEIAQIRKVMAGDACPKCGAALKTFRGIEAGHIFVLGTHYSSKMDASYLDKEQKKRTLVMGCYGIGVSRLVAAAVEQHNDADGLCWPMRIAPYPVHIVQMGESEAVVKAVNDLEAALAARGIETLIDDRDERPGVKFKDADLIGIPLRVTIGERALAEGNIELKPRTEKNPKNAERIPLDQAAEILSNRIREMLGE